MEVIHESTDSDGRTLTFYRKPQSEKAPVPLSDRALLVASGAPVPVVDETAIPTSSKKALAVTAHKRESYSRSITTKSITFVCAHCGQTVTQQRYPSPKPMYCTAVCKKEVEREQTRLRVQNLRAKKKASHVG